MESVSQTGSPATSTPEPKPIRFSGNGAEYFRIWIVNLLLTIVTVGIYSAWAKVRRLQYFYRHTALAGSSFDFHGNPIRILTGRLIALALLIGYRYSASLHSRFTILVVIAIAIALPWLLRNSLRFRQYNSSWRGVRFHFRGSVAGSYRVFLLNGFLTLITLYMMAPFMHHRLKAYQHDNSWFARTRFSFHARASQFYFIYLLVLAALVVFVVVIVKSGLGGGLSAILQMQRHGGHVDMRAIFKTLIILYGTLILTAIVIGPIFHALITNLVWNNTRLGEHRIRCDISPIALMWIGLSNFVLVVLTLGLFTPWAMVRLARVQLNAIQLLPASDLQEFMSAEPETVGAVGEEAVTAFDFDISL
jgi:uncharacterized membrane protein YjgN (DUF898 family)